MELVGEDNIYESRGYINGCFGLVQIFIRYRQIGCFLIFMLWSFYSMVLGIVVFVQLVALCLFSFFGGFLLGFVIFFDFSLQCIVF